MGFVMPSCDHWCCIYDIEDMTQAFKDWDRDKSRPECQRSHSEVADNDLCPSCDGVIQAMDSQ